jgi:hypothetical protein
MIACAGSKGSGENQKGNGIVSGHMYTLLDTCECTYTGTKTSSNTPVKPVKLIKLRNPWGSHEWNGAFSDHDKLHEGWKPDSHSLLSAISGINTNKTQPTKNDGVFWMPFHDFLRNYDYFCLCAVSSNISSLHLDMCEEYGICGPLVGAVSGAGTYCCMCEGVSHLWCPNNASTLELIYSFKNNSELERNGSTSCCSAASRNSTHHTHKNSNSNATHAMHRK